MMAKATTATKVQMFNDFICSRWLMRQFDLLSSYHRVIRNCNAIDCGPMQCGVRRGHVAQIILETAERGCLSRSTFDYP